MKQLSDGSRARRLLVLLMVSFGAASLADCSLFRRHGGAAGEADIIVEVRNDNWLDMTIYLVRNGESERVGTVGSFTRRTFRLKATRMLSDNVQLMADPIGSNATYLSPNIIVNPGQTVRLTVMNALSLSHVAVY